MLDACAPAVEAVRARNAAGGRLGLRCEVGNPADPEGVQLADPSICFDLVVDKVGVHAIDQGMWLGQGRFGGPRGGTAGGPKRPLSSPLANTV